MLVLSTRLDTLQGVLELARQTQDARHTARLEYTVIILIFLEILLGIVTIAAGNVPVSRGPASRLGVVERDEREREHEKREEREKMSAPKRLFLCRHLLPSLPSTPLPKRGRRRGLGFL